MPNAASSLSDDPGEVLRNGAPDKSTDRLRRVSDRFLNEVDRLNEEQIGVFDEAIEQLINVIEAKTPAKIRVRPRRGR